MQLTITALGGMPRFGPGDDLSALLIAALDRHAIAPCAGDILVVTQKIVSKAEGRYLDLRSWSPRSGPRNWRPLHGKTRVSWKRFCRNGELIRAKANVLIVATRHGLILANAGIDQSNLRG